MLEIEFPVSDKQYLHSWRMKSRAVYLFHRNRLGRTVQHPSDYRWIKARFLPAFYLTPLSGQFGLKADSAAPAGRTTDFARTVSTAG